MLVMMKKTVTVSSEVFHWDEQWGSWNKIGLVQQMEYKRDMLMEVAMESQKDENLALWKELQWDTWMVVKMEKEMDKKDLLWEMMKDKMKDQKKGIQWAHLRDYYWDRLTAFSQGKQQETLKD